MPLPSTRSDEKCAGGLALMHRELELRDRLGSHEAYFNVRGPYGVGEDAFNSLRSRLAGTGLLPAEPNQETQDRLFVDWIPWPVADGDVAIINPPCDCAVCTNHAEAHEQVTLTTVDGGQVGVDRDLAELVQWLWDQGAVTVGSCQSMVEAIERLWPEKREIILSENNGTSEHMNYRKIVTKDLAFIRGLLHPAFADLADAVEALCDDREVAAWGPGVHVAFPLIDAGRLLEKLTAS